MTRRIALALGLVVLSGCSDDPPKDVAGDYAVTVSNDDDDCSLDSFAGGATTLTLTQDVDDPEMVASDFSGGPVAAFLGVSLGGAEFTGEISGSKLTLNRRGTDRTTAEFCEWHVEAELEATVNSDDQITGTITYTGEIDFETADCPFVDECVSAQSFDGTKN